MIEGDVGLVAYIFFCLTGMLMFVQGLAYFSAGLTSPRSALSQLAYSIVVSSAVMIQYYSIGYSLESSNVAGSTSAVNWRRFVGDLDKAFFHHVDFSNATVSGRLLLRYGFSVVPACLLASAACQRGRFIPLLVFIVVWMTFVYCPVAYWCWHESGWSLKMGALDYAGGTIIHITAGFGALVYSLVLGPRVAYNLPSQEDQPFSLAMVIQGTSMMWLGWIGFTGGSQVDDAPEALLSILNTMLSAAMGGFSWMVLDHCVAQHQNDAQNNHELSQYSLVSFCSGVISGLVAITPGAGFVPPWAALMFGICGGIGCNFGTKLKFYLGVDDPLDVFAVHGIGGMIGTLLTGILATQKHRSSWQPIIQLVSATAVAAYTLGCTLVLAVAIDSVPWLRFRLTWEEEMRGTDIVEHGETATTGQVVTTRDIYLTEQSSGVAIDTTRLRQANVNAPMHPGSFDHLLLQRLPLSYGNYIRRDAEERDY